MKKILYTFLALSFLGCDNDDKLADESVIIHNGEESQSLNPENDLDKYLDETFAKPYNIQILYRFLEREISRIYTYTPTKYNKAIEFANVFNALKPLGTPKEIHLFAVIGAQQGIEYLEDKFPETTHLWIATIDPLLNEHGYIVPGLGDAGDLAFGNKME